MMKRRLLLFCLTACLVVGLAATSQAGSAYQNGDVFAAIGGGLVNEYTPLGGLVQTLNTGLGGFTTGMVFDAAGNLYVTDFSAQNVSKFDNNGNLIGPFGSGYNADPESIVRDAAGNFYVGQPDGGKQILKFDSAGNPLAQYSAITQNRGTDWIDLAADQHTMYYTSEGTSVKRFDVGSSTQLADFAIGLPGSVAYALRILPDGSVLVADTQEVIHLDSLGGVIRTYFGSNGGLFSLNLDPDGTSFWTGDFSNGEIYHVDIASGTLLGSFSTGSSALFGVAVFGERTVATTPDPGTLVLLSTGLAGLLLKRRKKA